MAQRIWQNVAVVMTALVLMAALLMAAGCENTPQDKLSDGKRALADGDLQQAEQRLEAALEADPEMVEARRLMATIYMEDQRFEAAERQLEQLWDEQGFDSEGELSADQRQIRQLMSGQFSELYRRWLDAIDANEEPNRYEQIAWSGLERNSRDSVLNRRLVKFYNERADRYEERGDKIRAAEMLENIDELHRFPDTRRQSRQRAEELRRQAFVPEAIQRFEQQLRSELEEMGAYDSESGVLTMTIGQPPDGRLDPDDPEAVHQARTTAAQTLVPTLSQYATAMAGLDIDDVDPPAVELPELKVEDEQFGPGNYEMTVALALDDLVQMAFDTLQNHRNDAEFEPGADPLVAGEDIPLDTSALEDDD